MGRIMRLREAVEDGQDVGDDIRAGGKPSTGTPKDKRLSQNKSTSKTSNSSTGGKVSTPSTPKATPAKVTHGL